VSGAALEVLERSLMSIRVRTEDGQEGWVKTAYVVTQEPARRRVTRLETANAALERENATVTSRLTEAESRIGELEAELATTRGEIEELPELKAAHAELEAEVASRDRRVPLLWVAIAAGAALVAGAAAGYLWLDRKVRSHFGGMRPY